MADWVNSRYVYRRPVKIEALSSAIPALHPVTVQLPASILGNNKLLATFEDLEVVYHLGDSPQVIYRDVLEVDGVLYVSFQAQDAIEAGSVNENYFVYTGNYYLADLMSRAAWQNVDYYPDPLEDPDFDLTGIPSWAYWPNSVSYDDTLISYTRPGEHWKDGRTEVSQARISTKLIADRFRLVCEVGPDQGIIQVRVNDREWHEVDLYSDTPKLSVVFVSTDNLRHNLNELVVVATGRSRYPSQPFSANIRRVDFNYDFKAEESGEEIRPISWSSYVGGVS